MNTLTRPGSVTANRHSGGGKPDGFCLQVLDEETHACVEVWFTPGEWALSLWGRGGIDVKVNWIDVPSAMVTRPEPSDLKQKMLAQALDWENAAKQPGTSEFEHEQYMAKAGGLRDFVSDHL